MVRDGGKWRLRDDASQATPYDILNKTGHEAQGLLLFLQQMHHVDTSERCPELPDIDWLPSEEGYELSGAQKLDGRNRITTRSTRGTLARWRLARPKPIAVRKNPGRTSQKLIHQHSRRA